MYSTDYDAANRLVQQKRGGSNNLLTQFSYFAWDTPNGNGRLPLPLRQIKAGTVASQTSLLDLRYYTGTNTPEYDRGRQYQENLRLQEWDRRRHKRLVTITSTG